jgi:tetratricopeptide (TPR) repeat protein
LAFEAIASGQPAEGQRLAEECFEIVQRLGHQQGIAIGFSFLGNAYEYLGKFNEALLVLNKALIRLEDIGYRREIAWSYQHLSRSELYLGQYEAARQHAQKGLAFFQKIGDNYALPQALWILGLVALVSERYEEAQRLLLQSVDILRETGVALWLGEALAGLVYVARKLGDLPQARQYLREALQTTLRSQNSRLFVNVLPPSALLLADQKAPEQAVELYALASRYPFVANSCWFEEVAGRYIAAVAATLPPDVAAAAQAQGQARALETTVTELLAEFEARKPSLF